MNSFRANGIYEPPLHLCSWPPGPAGFLAGWGWGWGWLLTTLTGGPLLRGLKCTKSGLNTHLPTGGGELVSGKFSLALRITASHSPGF
jgi:polyferredoxin